MKTKESMKTKYRDMLTARFGWPEDRHSIMLGTIRAIMDLYATPKEKAAEIEALLEMYDEDCARRKQERTA